MMNAEKQKRLEELSAKRNFIEQRIDQLEKEIDNYKALLDEILWARLELEDSVDEEDGTYD